MADKVSGHGPASGFFLADRDSRTILFMDDGLKEICPDMQVGRPCYQGFGRDAPCADCPMERLDRNDAAVGYRAEVGLNTVALRMAGEPPKVMVYYGRCGLSERRTWLESGRYQNILRQNRTIAFEYDPETGESFVSPFVSEYLAGRYDHRRLSQIMLEDGVVHPDDRDRMVVFRDVAEQARSSGVVQARLKTVQGDYHWYRLSVNNYWDPELNRNVVMGTFTDADEEIRFREFQRRQAEYDETTGIYHKEAFYRCTDQLMQKRPELSRYVVVLDIDRFKIVNDLFSPAAGDKLLRFLAQLIAARLRPGAEAYGRIRDDVFGMCLTRSREETKSLVEELCRCLEEYPLAFRLSPSAGICPVAPGETVPASVLCDRAVLALQTVKGNAVRQYAFYERAIGEAVRREQELISNMHSAIEKGQFIVYFQPKNDLLTGKIVGAEALVRWNSPEKGILSPGDFIPVFERNGLITFLDEYVWDLVCQYLRRWMDEGLTPPPVSVNVSRVHLHDPKLAEKIISLIHKYGLSPELLEIELTESAYVENPNLGELMEQLRDQGFTFAMDDFGSGYSSLNMLRSIPVDILKLDLHFLGFSEGEEAGKIIMESVIQMANRLCIPAIVEGVETEEQAEFLRTIGCRLAQGYLYDKPMPAEEFRRKYLEPKE